MLAKIQEAENSTAKIDANRMKKFKTNHADMFIGMGLYIDQMKMFQSILFKRLPPAIANGMINLVGATSYQNATSEDMENAVVKLKLRI